MTLTVIPAYGRDYRSKAAVLADWEANKDFDLSDGRLGPYINRSQAEEAGMREIRIRYSNLRKVLVVKV